MRRAEFTGSFAEFILSCGPIRNFTRRRRRNCSASPLMVMRAQGKLGETIGTLPRFRHGIVPVPDEIAPSIPAAGRPRKLPVQHL